MRVGFAGKSGSRARAHRGGNSRLLRIIGGTWRGRKLRFAAAADIRPTPDRVRETLFNWLGGHIARGAVPGSVRRQRCPRPRGALARRRTRDLRRAGRHGRPRAARAPARVAGAGRRSAACGRAALPCRFARVAPSPWCSSIRPLAAVCWRAAAGLLAERGWLSPGALIYVECAAREGPPPLPEGFTALKGKQAGEVGYYLYAHATVRPT